MKSIMSPQEQFTRIATPRIKRSVFDRSHGYKTTFNAGELIPIFVDEALPGDTMELNASIFGRLNTPLKPIMDNMMIDVHFFSVPIRLVWDNWVRMLGEQDNPDDTTDYIMPTITAPSGGFTEGSIYDYLGIPTKVDNLEIRADFLRAINLIWNQWYRDENLQDSVTVSKGDGPDASTLYTVLPRGKRKDYFTSALPFAQKATPVTIPLGERATVFSDAAVGAAIGVYSTVNDATTQMLTSGGAGNVTMGGAGDPIGSGNVLYADLSNATAATVNAWRQAFQIQVLYELDARGGTRHTEIILTHFGIHSADARLQRPEYLGGFTTNLNINPIAQNSASLTGETPQANLAAVGTFGDSKRGFTKSFTEHEIVIGFCSARADLNYQQGLNRMWSRSTRFDFFWPSLANLGEQAILNKEIYAQGTAADDDVFGYQERYSDYKFKPSLVTNTFRSNHSVPLDMWHLSQEFGSLPALNEDFVVENPPIERIVAVTSEPDFLLDCYFNFKHARPIPTYSIPASLTRL